MVTPDPMRNAGSIAATPRPPYYAVIFTSKRNTGDDSDYGTTAERMVDLASQQDGFLGVESVRDGTRVGITVSYWRDVEAIRNWHAVAEHRDAQALGRSRWYECFSVRICHVEREYNFNASAATESE